jgi:hypothetical protein
MGQARRKRRQSPSRHGCGKDNWRGACDLPRRFGFARVSSDIRLTKKSGRLTAKRGLR